MSQLTHVWTEGSLPDILERFIWVQIVDPVTQWPKGDSVRIVGLAKGPETIGDSGADLDRLIGENHQQLVNGLARATRETMYRQAEDAIAAAHEAGWILSAHPEIEMGGKLNRDRDTGLDVPCAECRVTLCFRHP